MSWRGYNLAMARHALTHGESSLQVVAAECEPTLAAQAGSWPVWGSAEVHLAESTSSSPSAPTQDVDFCVPEAN